MANRNFPQSKVFGFHLLPCRIRGSILIGASGAVTSFSGPGIAAVVRTGLGVYRIQLQDNYNSFLHMSASIMANGTTGAALDPNTATPGTLYQISVVGDTNWVTAGIPSGITPAIGMVFALAAAPAAGTGRVLLSTVGQISSIQILGNPNLGMLNIQPALQNLGGFITIGTMAPTSSSVTTQILANPSSGNQVFVDILCNNSSVQ